MILRLAVALAIGAARLAELAYSRRNIAWAAQATEGTWSSRTYPVMVVLHVVTIGGTALFGDRRPNRLWLLLLFAVQPMRAWILVTLGRRWNTRGAVDAEMEIATGGPYRFVRHPNYSIVAIELLALPMAFGLRRLSLVAAMVNAVLIAIRVHDEEQLLRRIPGYEAHFAKKSRFIPHFHRLRVRRRMQGQGSLAGEVTRSRPHGY